MTVQINCMRLQPHKIKHCSGVALVAVLLMLSVMVTLLAFMVESQFLSVRQTNAQQIDELSVLESSHAESWGQGLLTKADRKAYEADRLVGTWATEALKIEKDVQKNATLSDLQGRFNLNNLAGEKQAGWLPIFQRLLKALDLEEGLAFAIIDWVDEDENPKNANGAEDNDYLAETPARKAANQPFSNVEELLLVKGIDEKIFKALLPHISVLDEKDVKVNMNTATLYVLKAILPNGITSGIPERLVEVQKESGFETMQALLESEFMAGVGESLNDFIDIKSQYFEMLSRITIDKQQKKIQTGFKRELQEDAVAFSIIYRKREL